MMAFDEIETGPEVMDSVRVSALGRALDFAKEMSLRRPCGTQERVCGVSSPIFYPKKQRSFLGGCGKARD
jgi:hypothetical protein